MFKLNLGHPTSFKELLFLHNFIHSVSDYNDLAIFSEIFEKSIVLKYF